MENLATTFGCMERQGQIKDRKSSYHVRGRYQQQALPSQLFCVGDTGQRLHTNHLWFHIGYRISMDDGHRRR